LLKSSSSAAECRTAFCGYNTLLIFITSLTHIGSVADFILKKSELVRGPKY